MGLTSGACFKEHKNEDPDQIGDLVAEVIILTFVHSTGKVGSSEKSTFRTLVKMIKKNG